MFKKTLLVLTVLSAMAVATSCTKKDGGDEAAVNQTEEAAAPAQDAAAPAQEAPAEGGSN
jgi:hypothetical protein